VVSVPTIAAFGTLRATGGTMFLGIEIGGTKLQLGLGRGDGVIASLWRGNVDRAAGGEGIRQQIGAAVPELLARAGTDRGHLRGVGIGFGGPTDDATQTVIKSHHVAGWDGFPLAAWVSDLVGVQAVVCNDADTAGLGEALYGAGKGLSPIFYITVGTGIGGGLIIDGEIYRGVGRGAAEIGHLEVWEPENYVATVESVTSGPAIVERATLPAYTAKIVERIAFHARGGPVTGQSVVAAAREGDKHALYVLKRATDVLAAGICQVITLLCPARVVIGGGVSLIGEDLFFTPIREAVARGVFAPFAGLTDIVPAALGEEVVIHGALALARKKFGG
jgi:glucokinase